MFLFNFSLINGGTDSWHHAQCTIENREIKYVILPDLRQSQLLIIRWNELISHFRGRWWPCRLCFELEKTFHYPKMQDRKTDLTLLKSKKYSFKQCRGDEHKKSRNSKFLKKNEHWNFPYSKTSSGRVSTSGNGRKITLRSRKYIITPEGYPTNCTTCNKLWNCTVRCPVISFHSAPDWNSSL